MKKQSVRTQALILTCANGLTRALGFILRIVLSRLMGAQAVGVMELSHSAHMLSITPVTAGLPMAVSRMTARDGDDRALRAGIRIALRIGLFFMPCWLLLSPLTARFLRDTRVLPALILFTPCIPILGLSAVLNGYCYGRGNALPPALSEMLEQLLRFGLSAALLLSFPALSVAHRAAVPAFSTFLAEGAGLLLVLFFIRKRPRSLGNISAAQRELMALSSPPVASRLLTTLLRTLSGALIPVRLAASGLTSAQAMELYGMYQGMVMPLLFLPGIVTGSLGTVATSAVAARRGKAQRRMAARLFSSALACGICGMLLLRLLARFFADRIYALPALAPLIYAAAPLTLLFSLQHAVNGVMNGLGLQKKLLLPAVCSAVISLICMYVWAATPALRITGVIRAMHMGQSTGLLWGLFLTYREIKRAYKTVGSQN